VRSQKSQSSVEYLMIVGLSLLFILPASYLFYNYAKNSEDSVMASQISRAGNSIIRGAEEVYIIGNNSWITLELYIPDGFHLARLDNGQELIFEYYTQQGLSEAVFFSDIRLVNEDGDCDTCDLPFTTGTNNVRITSRGGYVSITRT